MSGAVREERKVVTAVFADLVGSTALAERLDPEEVQLIVAEAIARVVRVVEEFGGTVKDLAGDGVLALFGAPAAHEDDEERAVRASLRIVEEIEAYGREVERGWGIEGFSVRVGVNTGPVVLGPLGAGDRVEYAAFGDTVNTAARLQSAAPPAGVLVSEDTRRRVAPMFVWAETRDLELKGKSAPVRAHALRGVGVGPGPVREQARFVGREPELSAGRESVERVLRGAGGILFLVGEPGIGKSRLLAEVRRVFEETPCEGGRPVWIEGRCASYGESTPYWPFRDLLRTWLGAASDEGELRVRVALRRRLEQLFPGRALEVYPYLGAMLGLALEADAAGRLAELSPEALQYRTFEVVGTLLERLSAEGPVAVAIEDLHWADPTSVQLVERLLPVADQAAVLLLATGRQERDHAFWAAKELAAREFPHRTTELSLEPLSGRADRDLLAALVGERTLPDELEDRVVGAAEGNPFFLEELVRSLVDAGALVRADGGWRFDHEVAVEVPPTVERVILARIDRLPPASHDLLVSASVLGRQFSLPLLEGVSGNGELRNHLHELQRLDLVREARRWPQPEYQFKHALIQEAAYRTVLTPRRTELHGKAARWLEEHYAENEDEALGLLAHHWLAAGDEEKAIAYLARAGDRARQDYALDEAIEHYRALLPLLEERGERQEVALVLFKLALALHTSLRFAEANAAYQRAFEHWTPPEAAPGAAAATLRIASTFVPDDADPASAIAWPDIQLCMQLFDRLVEVGAERTILPCLAERWDIADDGLRYVFHLRAGLRWSDGTPLTAHDVEYGIKRVLNPDEPGSSVAIYFVLENGQDYYLRHNAEADRIGVRALDDRTVEFRLVAPAPYFMSVMNRPDSAPQPQHVIDRYGARWTGIDDQVVSGPFHRTKQDAGSLVLERRDDYQLPRPGNARTVEILAMTIDEAIEPYARDEIDFVTMRYTPHAADLLRAEPVDAQLGPAAWSCYLAFDHSDPVASQLDFRRALAHAIDRDELRRILPVHLVAATGGVVPPALQGHTPDIALRYDPDLARDLITRCGFAGNLKIAIAGLQGWGDVLDPVWDRFHDLLGIRVERVDWRSSHETDRYPAPVYLAGWLPGYPDPEYFLRLLLQSTSKTNEGGFADSAFDLLIERARQERSDRGRLELFHEADRYAVVDRVALIPLVYGRSLSFVKPWVTGWSEFGKTSSAFADLVVDESSPRFAR